MRRGRRVVLIVLLAAALPVVRGLAVRREAPAGAPAPAASRDPGVPVPARLRLATWNIAWLNRSPGEGYVRRGDGDYDRLRRHAMRIDADILALQEIDGPEAARRVFDPGAWDLHLTGDEDNPQRTGFAFRRGLEVRRHPDLVALAVSGRRRGADLTVRLEGGDLRLLAIHLKSGCARDPLSADREQCAILRRQLAVLEDWIDARARETAAFAVIGDFNRGFDPPEAFWAEIDDGEPPGADLVAVTEGRRPTCWGGRYRSFIDHIVLGHRASGWLVPGSFRTVDYGAGDAPFEGVLSDHCPLVVTIDTLRPSPAVPPRITADEAAAHVGEVATVCGRVAGARFATFLRGRPTFLNLERPHPDQPFTVVIWGDDRVAFGTPEVDLPGRRICVTGLIRAHRGKPEIVARRPGEITIDPAPDLPAGNGDPGRHESSGR